MPYEYRIFTPSWVNKGLEVVIREELNTDQWKRYEIFQGYVGRQTLSVQRRIAARWLRWLRHTGHRLSGSGRSLTDNEIYRHLQRKPKSMWAHLCMGRFHQKPASIAPAMSAGSTTRTAMMWGAPRPTACGTKASTFRSRSKARRPCFFERMIPPEKSHVGIYLGNGMMVSPGDPIKYANIHSFYWEGGISPGLDGFQNDWRSFMSEK